MMRSPSMTSFPVDSARPAHGMADFGETLPADLVHDRQAAVLIRGARAARLCPAANSALADIIAAGGAADTRFMAKTTPAVRVVRKELRRMNPALARIGLRVAIDDAGIARLRVVE